MSQYDAIIIGAGHNGLTAAIVLAQAGRKVLVLERRNAVGGLAAGNPFCEGYISPGLLHDTSMIRTSVVDELGLAQHGLEIENTPAPIHLLAKDGKQITLSADIEATAESISRISKTDAEAYKAYKHFMDHIASWLQTLLDSPQPALPGSDLGQYFQLFKKSIGLRRLGKDTMMELLKILPMSVEDFLDEHFESDMLKAGLAFPAIFATYNGPRSAFTTMNLLLHETASLTRVKGGPMQLAGALEAAARAAGVDIRTGTTVSKIALAEDGSVRSVQTDSGEEFTSLRIGASISPVNVFFDLFSPYEINHRLAAQVENLRTRGLVAKVNLALNKSLDWKASFEQPIEYARTASSFTEMEKAFDAVKYRQYSQKPLLDIFVPTVHNKHLAPDGHEVVSILAQFAPRAIDGGWTDAARKEFLESVIETLAEYCLDLPASIVGSELLTPQDIEARYNIRGGHLHHVEHAIDQLIGRPIGSCAQFATPISGLFLCGSGSHPGGGLTCMPGFLGAQAMLSGKD